MSLEAANNKKTQVSKDYYGYAKGFERPNNKGAFVLLVWELDNEDVWQDEQTAEAYFRQLPPIKLKLTRRRDIEQVQYARDLSWGKSASDIHCELTYDTTASGSIKRGSTKWTFWH